MDPMSKLARELKKMSLVGSLNPKPKVSRAAQLLKNLEGRHDLETLLSQTASEMVVLLDEEETWLKFHDGSVIVADASDTRLGTRQGFDDAYGKVVKFNLDLRAKIQGTRDKNAKAPPRAVYGRSNDEIAKQLKTLASVGKV